MKNRFLITTAEERTWKFDRPVVFLGEWCRRYDRKSIWEKMDAEVSQPYCLSLEQKKKEIKFLRKLESDLFPQIAFQLNLFHGVNYSDRYWQILIGQWLRVFIETVSFRYNAIKQCLDFYFVSETSVLYPDYYSLGTFDFLSFIYAANNDIWNNILYSKILYFLRRENITQEKIKIDESRFYQIKSNPSAETFKNHLRKIILNSQEFFCKKLTRDTDSYIVNSYLPRLEEMKLKISFFQNPFFLKTVNPELTEPNISLRNELRCQMEIENDNSLISFLKGIFFESIPSCYLEGYENLIKSMKNFGFPKNPKFIFTSNNFFSDEIFKVWTAGRVEDKTPYFIGQHGNNYGVHRFISFETIEETTSDKFLTWGWKAGLPQHLPAFNFKTAGQDPGQFDFQGGLLLIEDLLYNQVYFWDKYAEFCEYFEDQLTFVQNLKLQCRKELIIRLHPSAKLLHWFEQERWADFDPSIKLDFGSRKIKDVIKTSRLVVHSYDSTGILETLSLNIPTLSFWQNNLDHVRDHAIPYYRDLIEVGIFHLSPESVANKINLIWDDVSAWWYSDKVQGARKNFCDQFSVESKNPLRDLKKILTK